ncbi:MAG: cbb3-type cytochrome c oxidase subunit I, partial [Candidatus Heimdallarchaeota archaeon]|nr:cbb3-type cytochrome c oxidase subunit I [Candidatus Heimdallarchaeota archaeon]
MAFEHSKEDFRVCPETNFRVDRKAEFLMIIYAVVAVLCLSLGGIAALMIGLHKTPGHAWSLLGNDVASSFEYYRWLNIHGFNMLIFWIVWFEMAAVYFVATALLNSKVFNIKLGYAGFALMLIGTVVIEILLFSANPTKPDNLVMFTAYYPLAAEPLFYLAYILFAVGVLLNGLNFFLTVYHAQKSGSYPYKTLPLVVYGVFVAVVIAVQAILNGAVVMVGSLLYSLGMIDGMDADWWKQVF